MSVSVGVQCAVGNVLYVRETSRRYTEDEAREAIKAVMEEHQKRNPNHEFVMGETGLSFYWRCLDGFDYGLYSYTLARTIELVWDGNTTPLWRKWRADADEGTQIKENPELPRMPDPDADGAEQLSKAHGE